MMRERYRLLLIIAVLLGIFYPSIFGEFNSIDDLELSTIYLNLDGWSLRDVFLPSLAKGHYYRPLINLSYILDQELWFFSSSFMHLENILLHLANSLLVYFLARRLLPEAERVHSYLPIAAALLFGLHPVNTESVNWVSGRTDLLAAFFVLSTALLLITYRSSKRKILLFFALCAFILGALTKEVALGFLPGGVLLLFAENYEKGSLDLSRETSILLKRILIFLLVFVAFLGALLYLRSQTISLTNEGIPWTLHYIFDHPLSAAMVMFRALGFYWKKLIFPLPLSFAITTVEPYYLIPGIAVAALSLYLLFRRTVAAALFLIGVGLILPSLPIAFGKIAWTPYAERYVYVASPFAVLALLIGMRSYLRRLSSPLILRRVVLFSLGIMAAVTFHRNFIWRTNLSLFEDSVAKNPEFARTRGEYGIALANEGRYEEAKLQFRKAGELPSPYYNEKYALNYAVILAAEGDFSGVEQVYDEVLRKTRGKSPRVYNHIYSFYSNRLLYAKGAERKKIVEKLESFYLMEYQKFHNPHVFYRVGQLYLSIGEREKSRASFKEALRLLPEGGNDRALVEKALVKLGDT